jgi:hypothetical protein
MGDERTSQKILELTHRIRHVCISTPILVLGQKKVCSHFAQCSDLLLFFLSRIPTSHMSRDRHPQWEDKAGFGLYRESS